MTGYKRRDERFSVGEEATMLHPGLAIELAKAVAEEHRRDALVRRRSAGERERIAARHEAERAARAADHALSALGALTLLAILLLGPPAALVAVAAAAALAIAPAVAPALLARLAGRRAARSTDRWQRWRSVEPDAEYLRRRAA
jgi:VIT1/CCC1 family predicted Fe2+/Mn2+ transporter